MPDTRVFSLPCADPVSARGIDWQLDARGLEWPPGVQKARWMPFACMRRITYGNTPNQGWVMRISGPPGSVAFGTGPVTGDPRRLTDFANLTRQILDGASKVGVARLAINHNPFRVGWLWARTGLAASPADMVENLPSP